MDIFASYWSFAPYLSLSRMRRLISLLLSVTFTAASYCGQAAIPFTFQSLRSGQPVLGCARPRCFGWNANGTRAEDTARFYRINGKEDGYLRRSDSGTRPPLRGGDVVARCDQVHKTSSCGVGEWIGGIAPVADVHAAPLQIQCCTYSLLQDTDDRGVAPIKPGQIYIGGEVLEGSKLVAFDYISDVTKRILPNKTILYEVSVRRMPCSDEEESPISHNAILDGDIRVRQDAINQMTSNVGGMQSPYGVQQDQTRIVQYGVQQQLAAQPLSYQQIPQYQQATAPLGNQLPTYQQPAAPYPYQPWFSGNVPQAPRPLQPNQPQLQAQQQPLAMVQPTPMPTLPPINLPKLEDFPQIEIPSVEQVEEVIPPMQKAILTNIAKFFGVL